AVPAPVQAPPSPPNPVAARTLPQRLGRLEEEILWRPAGRLIRHSMRPFVGAHQQPSKDALDTGLVRPAPP
ncbi:hypothetical protein Tco_0225793, partial [Tanacetum coccineum]